MKRFLIRGGFILVGGFVLLFLLRLGYGYLLHPNGSAGNDDNDWRYNNTSLNNAVLEKKNYASAKAVSGSTSAPDQKYEKIGSFMNQTEKFADDEARIRSLISKYKALIQSEQRSGLAGNQNLQLGIGVVPEKFDDMIADCRQIGKLLSLQINKTDKTNEYKDLQAKKTSLVQTRDALIALKSRSGKIDELMQLENRILSIEEQIQGLGVRLGEYDSENEFCTVKMVLSETFKRPGIPVLQRIRVAFEWTVGIYASLMFTFFCGTIALAILCYLLPRITAWIKKAGGSA